MRLSDLAPDEGVRLVGDPATEVGGISANSRAVRPGDLFAALSGSRADGRRFVADALARGAVAVLGDDSLARGRPAGAGAGGRRPAPRAGARRRPVLRARSRGTSRP